MEPSEIVRRCFEHGLLVSSEDIRHIQEGLDIDEFIRSKQPEIRKSEEREGRITTRLKKFEQKSAMTPKDSIDCYKNKYESLKNMLLTKTSAVSVGNARDSMVSVPLIGMAKQLNEKSFLLEDATGEIEVLYDGKAALENDDVICARGPVRGGKMVCKDIILPDIPLLRPIGRIEASLLLVPKPMEITNMNADVVASTEPLKTETKNIVMDSSPSHLGIYKDGKVQLLFYKPEGSMSQQEAINMLKKRFLKPPNSLAAGLEAFLIDPVPDILWMVGKGQDWIETYKGVTIVHSFEKPVLINLGTREARFV